MGIEDGASDFGAVLNELKLLATTKHPYETVAITLSKLWGNELAKAQEKTGGANDFGAYKRPAIAYMRQLMNWISRIDMHVILEAHEIGEWETIRGERIEVGQIPDYYQKFDHELDCTLRIVNDPTWMCIAKKSRLEGFAAGDSFPCTMAEIKARFGSFVDWTPPVPIELATAEQLTEINGLLEIINVSEKEMEKILSRASASTWEELNTEQIAATIQWLKGKVVK